MNSSSPDRIRERYLDLMVKTLANVIYGDPPLYQDATTADHPRPALPYDEHVRRVGRDWPSQAHTMIGIARLNNLRELTTRALREGVPGHFIETGVWRGGGCILMKAVVEAFNASGRRVYVADSFQGLPPARPDLYPADQMYVGLMPDQLRVSADEVRAHFAAYDLLDDDVIFLEGLFQVTLPKLQESAFALIRLDGDMYESTIVALAALYPKVSPGGFIIIDDYGAIPACRAAVNDFRSEHSVRDPMHEIDWTGVWWQKPLQMSAP